MIIVFDMTRFQFLNLDNVFWVEWLREKEK